MGYPVTLNGRTYTLADFSGQNYAAGFPDALEDFVTDAGAKATAAASSATAAAASETAAAASATAAAASVDAIEGFYLGAQASNPTVDLNGSAITVGDFYFNTSTNQTRIYNGSSWDVIAPDLVGDSTPQLGGTLDFNGNIATSFTSTGIDDNATSTAITIDSSQNVDIDGNLTAGDGTAISMSGTSTGQIKIDGDGYDGAIALDATGMHIYHNSASRSLIFGTNETERMRINSAGNLGIGAITVNRKLELAGNNNGGAKANYLRITDTDTTATAANQQGGIEFYASDSSGGAGVTASMEVVYAGSGGGGEITFNTAVNSGAGVAEAMRIDEAGNVGIGSASNHAGARVVINDTPPTAFGSPMLQVGQETFTASGYYSIGLGYTAGSYTEPPAEIAAVATSSSGGTTADIVFGTRSVTTNTAVTERMRIDSSGNVGIGTAGLVDESLSLLATHNLSFAESSNSSYANIFREASSAATVLASGYRRSGTANKMDSSIAASWAKTAVWAGHESIRFYVDAASADAVGTDLTPTERMRVKATGVGIGTTSPNQLLTLGSSTSTATIGLDFETAGTVRGSILMNAQTGEMAFTSGFSSYGGFMTFDCNGAERMRIDTSGNLLVGCDSYGSISTEGCQLGNGGTAIFSNDSDVPLYLNRVIGSTGYTALVSIYREDAQSGFIGASQGATPTFAAPSDIRLKNNVTDHESELTNLMALRPVRWDWKDETRGSGEGFVAQELEQTAWADLVSEGEDGYKIVSGLGAVETRLIKALQEAVTRIETLEAEVAALRGE